MLMIAFSSSSLTLTRKSFAFMLTHSPLCRALLCLHCGAETAKTKLTFLSRTNSA